VGFAAIAAQNMGFNDTGQRLRVRGGESGMAF
jgi:hypothetical protein